MKLGSPPRAALAPFVPQIRLYQRWLARERGLSFDSYEDMWRWSVRDLDAFWQSIWDYYELHSPTPYTAVLARNVMPGASWFPGASLNYAQQVLRHVESAHAAGQPAIISDNELGEVQQLSWPQLRERVAALALSLQRAGVVPGDRVAAYMPNVPQTIIACLATVSIGAVWSVCAPDMGTAAVLDRFKQITPKVLIACNGIYYGGKALDRSAVVQELRAGLPTVQTLVLLASPHAVAATPAELDFEQACSERSAEVQHFVPMALPFDHPLWVVYSSGTTGLPKPIVHGHGGILLTLLALKGLHNDVGCSYLANSFGERFHWYSSTGWVMWNAQMGGLATGTTICIYDGNPGGSKERPDWTTLWRFAARHQVSFFGAGAAFFGNCMKAGVALSDCGDLSRVRALGCTGSPLAEEVQRWGSEQMQAVYARYARSEQPEVWWCNISGGTDFCGAFIGGHRELPQVPGQMQCRLLGCAVEAWDEQGRAVFDAVGELVCTQPIPSMPLKFWGDEGNQRYFNSYFDTYPAGLGRKPGGGDAPPDAGPAWRHGDWLRITPDGGCVIYGRSDATINRHGLRMGTSEIYSAVEALPQVLDSMVVDLEYLGRPSYMPLFVVLREGLTLTPAIEQALAQAIRQALSPRFVPDAIFQVPEIPRTLSGKKQELPIKKLMLGQAPQKVLNRDAMANPGCLDWYIGFAAQHVQRLSGA